MADSALTADAINAMLEEHWPAALCRCVELSDTSAVAVIEANDAAIRPGGFASGPTQFAVADAALWFLVSGALGRVEAMALTIEMSIRYVRPARGAKLFARATLERLGRRQLVGTVRVWADEDESRPCSIAQGTYILPESQ